MARKIYIQNESVISGNVVMVEGTCIFNRYTCTCLLGSLIGNASISQPTHPHIGSVLPQPILVRLFWGGMNYNVPVWMKFMLKAFSCFQFHQQVGIQISLLTQLISKIFWSLSYGYNYNWIKKRVFLCNNYFMRKITTTKLDWRSRSGPTLEINPAQSIFI